MKCDRQVLERYSLCMLRFRSSTTSFGVASSMARECHRQDECVTERREMRRKPKKTQRNRSLVDERRKENRLETTYCSLLTQCASVTYAASQCRARRQTYGGAASSRRRLLRVATGGGKHKSLRDCAVPGHPPPHQSPRVRFPQLFHPKLRR